QLESRSRVEYLGIVESPDDAGVDQLIAERTLALSNPAAEVPMRRPRRFVVVVMASLSMGVAAVLGLLLGWPQLRSSAAPTAELPAPPTRPPEGGGEVGFLNCNSWPTAYVFVDGRRLPGTTPLREVPLPPGTHTLTLVSRDGLLRKELQVSIQAAQTRTLAVTLER
ncbi:MAG: hypothetical protein RMK29_11480, partial [Myxococcales bacterium]|nr:hypothetical protein [Myxococcales bacterium]